MQHRKLFTTAAAFLGVVVAVLWCRGAADENNHRWRGRTESAFKSPLGRRGAKSEVATASLSGRVSRAEDSSRIHGAVVTIALSGIARQFLTTDELPLLVITNEAGEWSTPITPGTYVVSVTARGFLPDAREPIVVTTHEQPFVEFALHAGGSRVRGSVADMEDGGISNVRITARFTLGRDFSTVTKDDGSYELTLVSGAFALVAHHDDYVGQLRQTSLGTDGIAVEDFVLVRGAVLRGQVIAADTNTPMPDAEVTGERPRRFGNWRSSTRTDENGVFTLRGVPSGMLELVALADGYASVKPTVVELGVAEQEEIRMIVGRAFSIRGRVVTKAKPGRGIRDVGVRASPVYRERPPLTLAATDDEGRFTIVGVMPGFYELVTSGNTAVNSGYMQGVAVEVAEHDVEDVLVELDLGVRVAGRLDPPTRGRVSTKGGDGMQCGDDHVDADDSGRFVLEHQRAGRCIVVGRSTDGRGGNVEVTFGEDASDLVVRLEPLAGVSGRIVDAIGRGVAGVNVTIERAGGWNPGDPETVSNSDGSFAVKGIEPGKLRVLATHSKEWRDGLEGYAKSPPLDVVAGDVRSDITITVQGRDQSLRGIVLREGNPVADARVLASRESDYGTRGGFQVLTKADGTFVIERLIEGQYTLVADDPRDTARAEVTNVKPGSSTTMVLVANGSVSGRVTVDGAPLRIFDLACWKHDGDQGYLARRFDSPDGVYALERVPTGSYGCYINSVVGRATESVVVSSGAPTRLDFSIARSASVTGVLVDVMTGTPVSGVLVYTGAGEDDIRAGRNRPTDANGRFTVPGIHPGAISLLAVSKDWSEMTRIRFEGTLAAGQQRDLGRVEVVTPFRHAPGQLGFVGRIENNTLIITEVIVGGAADRAGIRAGETITTFEGRSMAKLYPHLRDLLVAGRTYALGTVRGVVNVVATHRGD